MARTARLGAIAWSRDRAGSAEAGGPHFPSSSFRTRKGRFGVLTGPTICGGDPDIGRGGRFTDAPGNALGDMRSPDPRDVRISSPMTSFTGFLEMPISSKAPYLERNRAAGSVWSARKRICVESAIMKINFEGRQKPCGHHAECICANEPRSKRCRRSIRCVDDTGRLCVLRCAQMSRDALSV